jgi:hypothetical protein
MSRHKVLKTLSVIHSHIERGQKALQLLDKDELTTLESRSLTRLETILADVNSKLSVIASHIEATDTKKKP